MNAPIRSFFEENGYYHARGVFSAAEIAELEPEFDRIVAQIHSAGDHGNARWDSEYIKKQAAESTVVVHTHNVHVYSALWLRAFLQEKFLDVASAILGPDILLQHSKLFLKPPEKGSPFPMHQDWTYFPTVQDKMIAGIIHVTEATDEMGCLRVYPGSHKLGRMTESSGQQLSAFLEKYPLEKATIVEAHPGDVVFFHYFTLHGSMPNRSQRPRKTVLAQLYAGDDCLEDRRHPLEMLVLRGWNYHVNRLTADKTKPR